MSQHAVLLPGCSSHATQHTPTSTATLGMCVCGNCLSDGCAPTTTCHRVHRSHCYQTPAGLRNSPAFQVVSWTGLPSTFWSQHHDCFCTSCRESVLVCVCVLFGRLRCVCVCVTLCVFACVVALCTQPLLELVVLTSRFLLVHGLVSDVNPYSPSVRVQKAVKFHLHPAAARQRNGRFSQSVCCCCRWAGSSSVRSSAAGWLPGCMSPRSQSKNPHAQSFQLLNNTKQTVTYFQSREQAGEKTWTGVSLGGDGASRGGWGGGPRGRGR